MLTALVKLEEEYEALVGFLMARQELSLVNAVTHNYRKTYLLSCASYYETEIRDIIKGFIRCHCDDARVYEFAVRKGVQRQYHTYFRWEETNNINSFLSLFGEGFKQTVLEEIRTDAHLRACVGAFLTIGRERNAMMHENYITYPLDKTFEELKLLNRRAYQFVTYLKEQFT
nr:HEPN domain-containing protein [Maliibacterium massiliense]